MDWRLGAAVFQVRSTQFYARFMFCHAAYTVRTAEVHPFGLKTRKAIAHLFGLLLQRKAFASCEGNSLGKSWNSKVPEQRGHVTGAADRP